MPKELVETVLVAALCVCVRESYRKRRRGDREGERERDRAGGGGELAKRDKKCWERAIESGRASERPAAECMPRWRR